MNCQFATDDDQTIPASTPNSSHSIHAPHLFTHNLDVVHLIRH